jgi:hypothetical protein
MDRMTTMFATFSTPQRDDARLPVRATIRSLAKAAIAVGVALAVMLALFALRFGLYAATHQEMPAVRQLFQSH